MLFFLPGVGREKTEDREEWEEKGREQAESRGEREQVMERRGCRKAPGSHTHLSHTIREKLKLTEKLRLRKTVSLEGEGRVFCTIKSGTARAERGVSELPKPQEL